MTKSRTYCVLPWNHISMESANLEYKMCCVTDDIIPGEYSALKYSPDEALQSPYMHSVRESMLKGEEVEACKVCYDEEMKSGHSMRTFYLNAARGNFPDVPKIEHLELRLGNLCNLKCVMCSPLNSSSYDDYEQIFGLRTKKTTPISEIKSAELAKLFPTLNELKQLTFRGGEPLINRRHEEVLDFFIQSGRADEVHLTYTTNGTVIPDRLKEDWKHFRKVTLWVSIDGIGEVNNFIRYPSQWQQVEANLAKIDQWANEIPQLCWGITTTVQAYNLHQIPELIKLTSRFESCYPYPFINSIHYPGEFKVENLRKEKISDAVVEIERALNEIEFPFQKNPLVKMVMAPKGFADAFQRNADALKGLIRHLNSSKGGDQVVQRALMDLTERILKNRNITDFKFLRKVF